ncbi:MAG: type I glyceraldehyde-3-phosphate dehydrogenase [Candidatus Roizmanbacteria bacterium]
MKKLRIGLNGFGRIGRAFTRIASGQSDISIQVINTSKTDPETLAYLLKYDSVYHTFDRKIAPSDASLSIDGEKVHVYTQPDPSLIPWDKHHVDIVIDCTGVFKTRKELSKHLVGSVKRVILTAPTNDDSIPHIVMGINHKELSKTADIISNTSCTTNCAAVLLHVLEREFGIKAGYVTTAHSYTSSQPVLDTAGRSFTRSRAAGLSMIPTTTGAAEAVCKVTSIEPHALNALSLRVPTPVGSLCDVTALLEKSTSVEEIHKVFKYASLNTLRDILAYEEVPLVSSDYIGNPASCTYDANYTSCIGGNFVKVFGWYDNEWGYSSRLLDLVRFL